MGSGVNFQRRGFKAILEQLFAGHIRSAVVAHQDRWSRISFDFFQWLFARFGAELKVLHAVAIDSNQEPQTTLMEIITVFTARYTEDAGALKQGSCGSTRVGCRRPFLRKCFDVSRVLLQLRRERHQRALRRTRRSLWTLPHVFCEAPKEEKSYACVKHAKKALPWKLSITSLSAERVMKSDCDLLPEEEWQKEIPYDTRQLIIKGRRDGVQGGRHQQDTRQHRALPPGLQEPAQPAPDLLGAQERAHEGLRALLDAAQEAGQAALPHEGAAPAAEARARLSRSARRLRVLPRSRWRMILRQRSSIRMSSVAMDPGVRTFQTCYSPDGVIIESDVGDQLQKFARRADLMRSLKKRRRVPQPTARSATSPNLHYQTAVLLTPVQNILLPHLRDVWHEDGPSVVETKRQMDFLASISSSSG